MTDVTSVSRRDFLRTAAGASGAAAVGIFAFPPGLEVVRAIGGGLHRITRTYDRVKIADLNDLVEGEPLDFSYPLEKHSSFLVKLGAQAVDGVGTDKDIVGFSYACSHMGCPLVGRYRAEHRMMGPCTCHFSTFDLAKNGKLIIGQATQSLPQILLELDTDAVFATGVTGLVYGHRDNLDGGVAVR